MQSAFFAERAVWKYKKTGFLGHLAYFHNTLTYSHSTSGFMIPCYMLYVLIGCYLMKLIEYILVDLIKYDDKFYFDLLKKTNKLRTIIEDINPAGFSKYIQIS